MNLYLRLLIVLIASLFKPRLRHVTDPASLIFHVLPNDLDLNVHMNNGRYMTIMDLGRLDLVLRTGLFRLMMARGYLPVLGSANMRWRLPLGPFQRYRLETRAVCWDDKWIYLEQRFVIAKGAKAGAVAAIGTLKGSFYDRRTRTTVPTNDLLSAIGIDEPSPPMPAHIREWQKAEETLRSVTSEEKGSE